MDSIEKIDTFLNLFYDTPNGLQYDNVWQKMKHVVDAKFEVDQILTKLEKDGYLFSKTFVYQIDKSEGKVWFLSFEGGLFKESGGYKQKIISDSAENIRLEMIETNQRVNQNVVTFLTIVLAVGALIAAIYYATELYWKYHWFH